jgi:isopentenyl diphosphate isomerase/L-lactate dehydrogenase-like FMN-dependent dehydrogenase
MAPFVASRPSWLLDQALDGFQLDLVHAHASRPDGRRDTADEDLWKWIARPPLWSDFEWIRERFGGPIVVKGVLSTEDAKEAVDRGASAIIVSNHGGRQLDGAPATFAALPDIVDAVGDQVEVLVDGGIRSGADVVRALHLGARAAMVGRAWAYGLCAAGLPGISRVLELIREDVDRTLRLTGESSI